MKIKFLERPDDGWCMHDEDNDHIGAVRYLGDKKWDYYFTFMGEETKQVEADGVEEVKVVMQGIHDEWSAKNPGQNMSGKDAGSNKNEVLLEMIISTMQGHASASNAFGISGDYLATVAKHVATVMAVELGGDEKLAVDAAEGLCKLLVHEVKTAAARVRETKKAKSDIASILLSALQQARNEMPEDQAPANKPHMH